MSNVSVETTNGAMGKVMETIDARFCERIMRVSEGEPSIRVTDVLIKPATSKGDNYTSDMFRATVEFVRSDGKGGSKERKPIIVKFVPIAEGVHKDLVTKSSLFGTEILMMSDTLVKMNDVLSPGPPLNGRCLYTQESSPTFLVIEDLAPLGYRMADRQAGLDLDHCLHAIRGLARFHASSVVVVEKYPEQKNMYKYGMFNLEQPPEMSFFFTKAVENLSRGVAKWPKLGPRYADRLAKLSENIYEMVSKVSVCKEGEFNVINHGDFWVNNMLFKYDENNKVTGHIFVDFQLCVYAPPALDLQYFFNTSLSEDTLLEHQERLLEEYLNTLGSAMAQVNCATEPPTMAELKASMNDFVVYGMGASFSLLPIMLADKNEARDLGEMISSDEIDNPIYTSEALRKALARRLPKFEELGLLD